MLFLCVLVVGVLTWNLGGSSSSCLPCFQGDLGSPILPSPRREDKALAPSVAGHGRENDGYLPGAVWPKLGTGDCIGQ